MKKDKLVFRRFNGFLWLALVLTTGLLFNFNPALGQGTKPLVGLNATTHTNRFSLFAGDFKRCRCLPADRL